MQAKKMHQIPTVSQASRLPTMLHARINSSPWGPDFTLARFDKTLNDIGSRQLEVCFETMPLEDDGEHFTREGQRMFNTAFAESLRVATPSRRIVVVADSAIDFHNWSDDGEWTGWASTALQDALSHKGFDAPLVDAICGSGFVARAQFGEHFYARVSRHLRAGYRGPVVFVGGWNDARIGRESDVANAMRRCGGIIERFGTVSSTSSAPRT